MLQLKQNPPFSAHSEPLEHSEPAVRGEANTKDGHEGQKPAWLTGRGAGEASQEESRSPRKANPPGPRPGGGLRASQAPEARRESSEPAPPWDATSHHHILCPPWTQCQGGQKCGQVPKGDSISSLPVSTVQSKMALHQMFKKINAVQSL